MNLFQKAISRNNTSRPPVWMMRQAGRYHSHYQALRAKYSFIELCKKPEIACEVTMGPIRDFDFDAAIMFSDLLFPLEAMGMGLSYTPSPTLSFHLKEQADLAKLKGGAELVQELAFQESALKLIRKTLPTDKGLIGFVGGPLTLFSYAVDGSHQGGLKNTKKGFDDGRYDGFCEKLLDLLAANMALQAHSGIDTIAVLDTCAGEFDLNTYKKYGVPILKELFSRFQKLAPNCPITYYSKGTSSEHIDALDGLPISCLGLDWRFDLPEVLQSFGKKYAIQGNFDPELMLLEKHQLESKLFEFFEPVSKLPQENLKGWICGLGHGILQKTPETSVRTFMRIQNEVFGK